MTYIASRARSAHVDQLLQWDGQGIVGAAHASAIIGFFVFQGLPG